MAYPIVSAPYGLKPINLIGGQVFSGATRQMEIASGYATSIFYGDLVKRVSDGTIEKDTGTTTATPCGVFLGVNFTNASTGQIQQQQYYPASTAIKSGTKIFAVVADDPDTLFQVAVVSGTTVITGVGISAIGNNATLVQNAGSTTTGDSNVALLDSTATTNTLPIRIIDVVRDTATAADVFPEVIVKINFGMHQYNNATGV
tara:strand:+ start:1769 stop:2374 length:606 start_codon:yes stop_codon:yes gene_type:complete